MVTKTKKQTKEMEKRTIENVQITIFFHYHARATNEQSKSISNCHQHFKWPKMCSSQLSSC